MDDTNATTKTLETDMDFFCDTCGDHEYVPTEAGELEPCPDCTAERWELADLAERYEVMDEAA